MGGEVLDGDHGPLYIETEVKVSTAKKNCSVQSLTNMGAGEGNTLHKPFRLSVGGYCSFESP